MLPPQSCWASVQQRCGAGGVAERDRPTSSTAAGLEPQCGIIVGTLISLSIRVAIRPLCGKHRRATLALYRRTGSSTWQYDFTVAGIRYRGTTKQKTQARAKVVEAELITKARNKELLPGTRKCPMFSEFAQEFTDHIEQTRLMPGTIRYYKAGLEMLKQKPLVQMRLDRISDRVIETTPFSGSGSHVNCALRTLRRMLNLAREWKLLAVVPKIKLARENRRSATFDPVTEKLVLDHLKQPWHDVFLIMYDAGMRDQEAVALRWEHINFAKSVIFNPRVKAEDTDGWVPMSERLKQALKARHRSQKQGWVFPSKRSATGHVCPENLARAFRQLREKFGLAKELVPYSARHTFGTAMLEMTGNVVLVGKLLGHKNPLTTTRYLHPELLKAKQLIDRRNEEAEVLRHSLRHSGPNSGSGETRVSA